MRAVVWCSVRFCIWGEIKGLGLQIQLTVEDAGVFTMPWSATVTFRRALDEWPELVSAENPEWYPGAYSEVPTADKPDF